MCVAGNSREFVDLFSSWVPSERSLWYSPSSHPPNVNSITPVPSWPTLVPWNIWETSAAINAAQIFQINKFTTCETRKVIFHVRWCCNLAGTWGPYDCVTATEDLIHSPGAAWWWYFKLQPVLLVEIKGYDLLDYPSHVWRLLSPLVY